MCQINLIYKLNKKPLNFNEAVVLNLMTFEAFKRNKDGEGFFCLEKDKYLTGKSESKILFNESVFNNSYLVATHQRYSTTGHNKEMIHPYTTDKLILLHNGIFSGIGNNKESDTFVYTQDLNDRLKQNNNLIKSIKEISKEKEGSFSILVYEIENNKLYYYKNNKTFMYYFKNKDYLILSTDKDNINIAVNMLNIGTEKDIKEVEDFKIFDIFAGFKEVAKIEKPKEEVIVWKKKKHNFGNSYNGSFYGYYTDEFKEKDKHLKDYYEGVLMDSYEEIVKRELRETKQVDNLNY